MEGKFLNIPGKSESKTFIRKKKDESQEKFDNVVGDMEKRVAGRKEGPLFKLLNKYEIKKTPEQREVINFVIEGGNDFLKQYGIENQNIRAKDIYIEKDEFWNKIKMEDYHGICIPLEGAIAIRTDGKSISNTSLATRAIHELVHNAAFGRFSIKERRAVGIHQWSSERAGLRVGDPREGNDFMNDLNEAVTAELEFKFMQKNKDHPLFKEDFWKIKKHLSPKAANEASSLLEEENEEGEVEHFINTPYIHKRRRMRQVLDEILEKNPDEFENRDQVFEVFTRAYFSGRLPELSRLLKRTYGERPIKDIIREKGL